MNALKKAGRILLCPLPLIASLGIQALCTVICMVVLAIAGGTDFQNIFMDHYMFFVILIQLFSLGVFSLWYFLAYGLKQRFLPPWAFFSRKDVGIFLLLGLGCYCLISIYMVAASYLTPGLMAEYQAMVEETGMADLTFASTISTLILAPLSEELIFRGITQRLAQKAFRSFWIANLVQALCFGIAHMNWIQGSYAFLLGLFLGYVCHKYRTIYAGMLLHLAFNFFGTYLAEFLGYVPLPDWMFSIFMLVLGLPMILLCLRLIHEKFAS